MSDDDLREIPDLTEDEIGRLMEVLQFARKRAVTGEEQYKIKQLYEKVTENV